MNLAFLVPILFVGQKWGATNPADGQPLRPRHEWLCAVVAGVLIGAAFLTKIQAVLLPIPIAVWTLVRWRGRGLAWLLVAGLMSAAVFFFSWPWLQIDPVAHVREYLGRGVVRQPLNCWYFGTKYPDVDVPWHYPFVMFFLALPVVVLYLGAIGVSRRLQKHRRAQIVIANDSATVVTDAGGPLRSAEGRRAQAAQSQSAISRTWLLRGSILFVLTFFALPGITVYDGVRLFLVAYPLWAVVAGAGAQALRDSFAKRISVRRADIALLVLLAFQSFGIVQSHPCELSYYSLAVDGLSGADRLGLERTYWQDSFTRSFWYDVVKQVPKGTTLYLAPVMHPNQGLDLLLQSPILAAHDVKIAAYDDPIRDEIKYVIVFRRRADQWASLEPAPPGGKLLAEVTRSDVQLAALYELAASAPEPTTH